MSEEALDSVAAKVFDESGGSKWATYPDYKDSGVDWLDEIPAHWQVAHLKRKFSVKLGKMLQTDSSSEFDTLEKYLRAANIQWSGADLSDIKEMWLSPAEKKKYGLQKGDLLVSEGGDIGRSCIWNGELQDVYIQNAINRVRANRTDSTRFLFYWLSTLKGSGYIEILCNKSTIAHYTAEKVGWTEVVYPPPFEQQAIASFLDRETARIDALIARKQQLIDLLQEKRTALISQAVTKGLDPGVLTKDSGVEWLGEIPAHWDTCKLKRLASVTYGVGGELDRSLTEGTRIFSLPNVNIDGELLYEDVPFVELAGSYKQELLLRKGDLLFNWRNGSSDHLGKTAYFNLDGIYTHVSFLLKIRFFQSEFDPRYFQKLINGLRITGFFSTSKAGVNNTFNKQELENLDIIVPPPDEQKQIAEMLDRETGKIDALIQKVASSIIRSKEMRSALISAAVTGKINVR